MEENKINNNDEMRAAAVMLTACVNKMCNANNTDDASTEFIKAKELLVNLFKFNVERTSK